MTSQMGSFMTGIFTYKTNKSVVVRSRSVGIINRLMQLIILSYFVGYVFLHQRAYQEVDTAIQSSVITKVKGFGKLNNSVMDMADYIYPPQGVAVFSIITKIITTDNQFQGRCPETEGGFKCSTNGDCVKHFGSNLANGYITGVCNTSVGSCEIEGWCPAENDNVNVTSMEEFVNFTVYIKNSIRFPLFNVTRGNLPSNYVKNCSYDKLADPFCPIFRVGYILNETRQNVAALATKGGQIGITIEWKCNLDYNVNHCVPKYSFTKLDAPFENVEGSKGYNFRFAKYYKTADGTDFRRLHKAFAVRFDIMVTGFARKFNLIPTVINIIAAFTSIGMGTVLCDVILLNCLQGAEHYKQKMFEEVPDIQIQGFSKSTPKSQLSVSQVNSSCYDSGGDSPSIKCCK